MLTLIAAHDRQRAIGRGNSMPWHLPEDFAFFRKVTTGHPVAMGRKTWESLPKKPLPGRENIVVTRGSGDFPGARRANLAEAIDILCSSATGQGFCIGGAEIYAAMLPHAHRLLLTQVNLEVERADAFFPAYQARDWTETRRILLREDAPHVEVLELIRRARSVSMLSPRGRPEA